MNVKDGSILIVDDDADIRESLGDFLHYEGYHVETAEHGKRALEMLNASRQQPGLILLDLMMPVMDGFEFRALQRGNPKFAAVPVVLITAGNVPEDDMGAEAVFTKPIDVQELLNTLEEYCH